MLQNKYERHFDQYQYSKTRIQEVQTIPYHHPNSNSQRPSYIGQTPDREKYIVVKWNVPVY